jgi:hypothetical protein
MNNISLLAFAFYLSTSLLLVRNTVIFIEIITLISILLISIFVKKKYVIELKFFFNYLNIIILVSLYLFNFLFLSSVETALEMLFLILLPVILDASIISLVGKIRLSRNL